jgi:RAMP superfamily
LTRSLTLPIDLRCYWLHARGEGGGADFDLVMDRDEDGLPVLRGKHVAGLLRLALRRAVLWQWYEDEPLADEIPLLLMGGEDEPGCLDVRSAQVAAPLRAHFLGEEQSHIRAACFRRISSTAIDPVRSVAKQKHLRTVEAAVPLPLEFVISFDAIERMTWTRGEEAELAKISIAEQRWLNWIERAWPAFDEIGAKRTRGFGRLGWMPVPGRLSLEDGS